MLVVLNDLDTLMLETGATGKELAFAFYKIITAYGFIGLAILRL